MLLKPHHMGRCEAQELASALCNICLPASPICKYQCNMTWWAFSHAVMQMSQDHELNMLLHLAAADTMELEASLRAHQQHVAQLLSLRLLPCGTAAAEASQNAVRQQQREVAAVLKLPVLDLAAPARILAPQDLAGKLPEWRAVQQRQ